MRLVCSSSSSNIQTIQYLASAMPTSIDVAALEREVNEWFGFDLARNPSSNRNLRANRNTRQEPVPDPPKTRTRACRYGFWRVRVRVGPRIPAGLPVVFPKPNAVHIYWALPRHIGQCRLCISLTTEPLSLLWDIMELSESVHPLDPSTKMRKLLLTLILHNCHQLIPHNHHQ